MIKNIFLLSLRNFFKNKIYTITILLSLAIGFAISNILIGFTMREINTDSHHEKKDRIYRLVSEDPFGREGMMSFMEASIPEYLVDNYPEIETSTLINTLRNNGISREGSDEKFNNLTILTTDSSFLKIFDYTLSAGNPKFAIGPNYLVLTRKVWDLLFKQHPSFIQLVDLSIDTTNIPLKVSGIIERQVENSHLTFDGLVYVHDYKKARGGICYILLRKDADPGDFEAKINEDPLMPSLIGPGKIDYYLQAIQDVYFDEENSRSFSKARGKLFIWISWAITFTVLFLAGFNFLNLFFNAFLKRWKEFGMKKVLGASIHTFRLTAIFEVAFYILVSFGLSMLITASLLPWFNSLLSSDLSISYYTDIRIIVLIGIFMMMIAVFVILRLTGYMYRINPVNIINNKVQFKLSFNRYMLSVQFIISIILLICSITIIRQTTYIRNKPLGFDRNILEVRTPIGSDASKIKIFQNLINSIPGVAVSSLCGGNPISDNMILRYDLDNDEFYTPYLYIGDANYLTTLGLTLVSGEIPSMGNTNAKLINEAFVRYFDMDEPVGQRIPGTKEDYISGVVKDFNIASLIQDIPPAIISINNFENTLMAKVDLEQLGIILPEFERYWKEVYPSYPFKYLLMSDELNKKHSNDLVFSKIIIVSALLSILITCFGLFALSWGTTQERLKEIGIRKVIGATSLNILQLLLINYLKIIVITTAIGIPLSIFLMNKWLEKFAYRIYIGVTPLILAGLVLLVIAFLVIGYHTIKSSFQNPVESLRYE
jgi:putative ABC transport system permease protein